MREGTGRSVPPLERKQTMNAASEKTQWIARPTAHYLGLAVVLAALVLAFAAVPAAQAEKAKKADKIIFASDRASGQGVNNPEGDFEIFSMNPDGKGRKQLTKNAADDFEPALSPDGQKIAFTSQNVQPSNSDGDPEVYQMDVGGSDQRNLTNNAEGVQDDFPDYSPGGKRIVYDSDGRRTSNPEGDDEIYKMDANGSDRENLTDNSGVNDVTPDFGKVAKG
jgi:Tol biopolymer transport system component